MAAILSYLDNEVSVLKAKEKDLHSLFLETNSLEDIDSLLLDFFGTQCNTTVLHDIIEIFSDRNALIHFLHLISRNSQHCTKMADKSHRHANGFIKVTLFKSTLFTIRIHRWSDSTQLDFEPEPHNHRWDFASLILRGGYIHEFWKKSDLGQNFLHFSRHHTDSHDDEMFNRDGSENMFCWFRGWMGAGDHYALHHSEIHRTLTKDSDTITMIVHGPNVAKKTDLFAQEPIQYGRQKVKKFTYDTYDEEIRSFIKTLCT